MSRYVPFSSFFWEERAEEQPLDEHYRLFLLRNRNTSFPLVDVSGRKVKKKDLSNVSVNIQALKEVLVLFLPLLRNALSIFSLKLVWNKTRN